MSKSRQRNFCSGLHLATSYASVKTPSPVLNILRLPDRAHCSWLGCCLGGYDPLLDSVLAVVFINLVPVCI